MFLQHFVSFLYKSLYDNIRIHYLMYFTGAFVDHPLSLTVQANTTVSFNCTIKAKSGPICKKTVIMWRVCDIESGLDCDLTPDIDGTCNGRKKTAVYETVSSNKTAIQCEEKYSYSTTVYYSKLAILVVESVPAIQG